MASKKIPTIVNFENYDLFRFNEIAKAWRLDFKQLTSAKLAADLTQVICADCQLGYAKFNTTVKQEGLSPEGVWTFAFVNEVKVYWRNYIVHPASIIIYAPGSEINAVSAANFEVVTFSVSEPLLKMLAIEMKEESFFDSLKSIKLMICQKEDWNSLRNVLWEQIGYHVQNASAAIDHQFTVSFAKKLLQLLKVSTISTDKVSSITRLRLLQEAERFMLGKIADPISIVDVANHCEVSERTLLYAFKKRFNVGAKAFMKILKLNHVHHTLHKATDIKSISSIARESGFWHMGQFFKDYKKFFGELPSETLKRPTPQFLMPQ